MRTPIVVNLLCGEKRKKCERFEPKKNAKEGGKGLLLELRRGGKSAYKALDNLPATAWLPPSSGPTRQYPSRKKPVMGDWENRARGFLNTKYTECQKRALCLFFFFFWGWNESSYVDECALNGHQKTK